MWKPILKDYFALPSMQESISQETHTITADAYLDLNQVPLVRTGITTLRENIYNDATEAATLITVEVYDTGVWTAVTLTDSASPATDEVTLYLKDQDFPYCTRLLFHANYAGYQARVTYTGMGSVPLARYLMLLLDRQEQFLSSGHSLLLANAFYNGDLMDGQGTASKIVYITPSVVMLPGQTTAFAGVVCDFGASGNCEVAAFTNANYWKRISLSRDNVNTITVTESAEAATENELADPEYPLTDQSIGFVDVHNDGTTGAVGRILGISSAHVVSAAVKSIGGELVFQTAYAGDAEAGEEFDLIYPGVNGDILSIAFCTVSGSPTGTTVIDVKRCSDVLPDGASIFASNSDKPTLTAGAHVDLTPDTDINTTAFTTDHFYRVAFDTVPTATEQKYTVTLRIQRT